MLFFKECKKILCSLTFVLYVVVVFVMYGSQFVPALESPVAVPQVGEDYYGTTETDRPEVVMPAAVESLVSEYLEGSYDAYPVGFYKQVKLKEKDTVKMAAIIEELTGLSKEELDGFEGYEMGGLFGGRDENGNEIMYYKEPVLPGYELSETVSYERFRELMRQVDDIIGGGSKYKEETLLSYFGTVEKTYEEALEDYNELMTGDNLPESYLRLFSDYAGIDLAIIPVFVCVALWQLDKRSRMEALVYSRKISSLKLLLARYGALVCCMAVPVLLTLLHAVIEIAWLYPAMEISFSSAVGVTLLWLLPSITVVTALGAVLTEAVSPLLAIFAQGAWWFLALESSDLVGDITRFCLIVRHNSMGRIATFETQWENFVWNRCFYVGLSAVLFLLAVLVYEWKRRGRLTGLVFGKGQSRKEGDDENGTL
ncbi:MAG: ABC transporter permease [Lachnospiraceae bacterium]|nr:ABC transporter permease [Lachnospiraceae bacterium]